MTEATTDQRVLHDQYGTTARLAARQAIWAWRTGPSLLDLVLDLAAPQGGAVVADVGCGNGRFLAELRRRGHRGPLFGFDMSAGMARSSAGPAYTAVADAQSLPVRDDAVDVALCLHMLYHVPDVGRAVRELRRVVRSGGTTVVATNGRGHAAEIRSFLLGAVRSVTGADTDIAWSDSRFDIVAAQAILAEAFPEVRVHEHIGVSVVPDPAPVRAYVASWPPESVGLHAGPQWDAVLAEADRQVTAHFADYPTLPVTSRAAVLVCR